MVNVTVTVYRKTESLHLDSFRRAAQQMFIGCGFRHGRNRRLAYQKSLPPLSPLARLAMFRQTVCDRRVAGSGGKRSGVSSTCSTSTVRHRRLPDLLLVAPGAGTRPVSGPSPVNVHAEVGQGGL
ncbi:MAG TPA: hypothetical protein VHX86_01270 [Tepidisphaeraceae bacterium]|jgi:hypothetical protein|nr:hypothetical protein [Tepidisphaeraceae bacterium]